jgi:hypothetical protein
MNSSLPNSHDRTIIGYVLRVRDEARVRAHLGEMDLKDIRQRLRSHLGGIEARLRHAASTLATTLHSLADAIEERAHEAPEEPEPRAHKNGSWIGA